MRRRQILLGVGFPASRSRRQLHRRGRRARAQAASVRAREGDGRERDEGVQVRAATVGGQMSDLPFLQNFSGQTVEQLLSLEGEYRIDSLVLVFEDALGKKAFREGDHALNADEVVILAVE